MIERMIERERMSFCSRERERDAYSEHVWVCVWVANGIIIEFHCMSAVCERICMYVWTNIFESERVINAKIKMKTETKSIAYESVWAKL